MIDFWPKPLKETYLGKGFQEPDIMSILHISIYPLNNTLIPFSMQFTNVGPTSRLVFSAVLLFGCSKSLTHSDTGLSTNTQPASYFTTDPSQSPFYGDSILYVQGTGRSAYLAKPVNSLGSGKFVAWPKGLTIDENTGEIDMLQSEPGSRYNVGFVNTVTGDTAYGQVILAGITYPDGVYFVHSTDSVLAPYYNASSTGSWLAGGAKQATEERGGTVNALFNEEGPNEPGAGSQHLIVDGGNGTLNLKASMDQGLFGSNPQNGDNKEIAIYYRLNDKSQMALQKTNVIVYYFNTLADVPQSLVDACLFSQNAFRQTQRQVKTTTGVSPAPTPVSGTATSTGGTKTAAAPAPPAPTPPRPPMVILVNAGHH
jgi:hypothetical protein